MKGLNNDFNIINQPPQTYPFALNVTATSSDSKFANLTSEPSNYEILALPEGYEIFGSIFTNESTIIFSGNGTNSQIGELSIDDNYTVLIDDTSESCKLNFNTYIKGREFRIRSGCDRTIYWSDNVNPDRYLNLDNLDSVYTNGQLDCNKFIFNREIITPILTTTVNNQGGLLESGSYAFVLEYLDDSENVLYKSIPTDFKPVFSDSLNDEYDNIYGSLNIEQFSADAGGTPLTNKSITIDITNVDETISFIRLTVIRSITSSGEIKIAHTIGTVIPITDDTVQYTYTGFNPDAGDTLVSYDSVIRRNVNYNRSRAMEQVQNRLVRANVTEQTRDYSTYQRFANQIVVEPQVNPGRLKDINDDKNSKNPNATGRTFMGDEIYALGIVYLHSNGQESPVQHIPGRSKISGVDDIIITNDPNNPDLKHLPDKPTYEQWEVYNTGDWQPNNSIRRMSYYESPTNYPTTLDCNGDPIYGDLAGQPIRHHKFPCRRNVDLQYDNSTFANYFGLRFKNVIYPSADIVGHRFVYVRRNNFNKTVLDAGYSTSLHRNELNSTEETEWFVDGGELRNVNDTPVQPNTIVNSTTLHHFVSPKVLGGLYTGGSHFKYNYEVTAERFNQTQVDTPKDGGGDFQSLNVHFQLDQINPTVPHYRTYNSNIFINPNATQSLNTNSILNFSLSNNANIVELEDEIIDNGLEVYYTYNKRYLNPYQNLEALRYVQLTPIITDPTQDYLSFDGDCFINELNTFTIFQYTTNNDDVLIRSRSFNKYFIESDINYDLRVEGLDCNTLWDGNEESITLHTLRKVSTFQGGSYIAREGNQVCLEYYYYNRDFDKISSYESISLPFNFDYCDRCLSNKPNRIIFSPKSFDEEIGDFYLYNYVNDYIDIPQEKGEIVGLKYKNNKLYVHCTDSTFILQPNPQSITTDQNVAFLSTGDFLGIPPIELLTTDLGYGGMQYELGCINTEFGYFWVDQKRGQIFKLSDSLDVISNKGLSMWFKENLNNNTELAYDPYFQRILFSHKNGNSECNTRWTLAFFPFYDAFISYYTYYPDLMFSTHLNLYSISSNKIWKHRHKDKYLSFYDKLYPFVIEEVKNDFSTDNLNNIFYYAEFFEGKKEVDDSFTSLIVYNNKQSTGKLNLQLVDQINNPYGNYNLPLDTKSVIVTDKNAKISNIYDLSTDTDVIRKACLNDNDIYSDLEFINTDPTKNQYEYSLFKDKYIKARLFYEPQKEERQLIYYLTQLNETQSIR